MERNVEAADFGIVRRLLLVAHRRVAQASPESDVNLSDSSAAAGRLQQVAPGPNRTDRQARLVEAAAKPQHMNVERVASRVTSRPARLRQLGPTHHCPEPIDEKFSEARLDRRHRGVGAIESDHPVFIDLRRAFSCGSSPTRQPFDPCPHVFFRCGNTNPVFVVVLDHRRWRTLIDQEETRDSPGSKLRQPVSFGRPSNQRDVHAETVAATNFAFVSPM